MENNNQRELAELLKKNLKVGDQVIARGTTGGYRTVADIDTLNGVIQVRLIGGSNYQWLPITNITVISRNGKKYDPVTMVEKLPIVTDGGWVKIDNKIGRRSIGLKFRGVYFGGTVEGKIVADGTQSAALQITSGLAMRIPLTKTFGLPKGFTSFEIFKPQKEVKSKRVSSLAKGLPGDESIIISAAEVNFLKPQIVSISKLKRIYKAVLKMAVQSI
jgi:hypothetical protein